MGAAGIEPANDGLEPSSLPLAYAPSNMLEIVYFLIFLKINIPYFIFLISSISSEEIAHPLDFIA